MTPAFVRAPYVQPVWPCALNTVQFAAVPGSKRNQCERWQGVKLVGVLGSCQTEHPSSFILHVAGAMSDKAYRKQYVHSLFL